MSEKDYNIPCSLCNGKTVEITKSERKNIYFIVCKKCMNKKEIRQKLTRIRYDYNPELDHYDGYQCDGCGCYLHPCENYDSGICSTCEPEEFKKWADKQNENTINR